MDDLYRKKYLKYKKKYLQLKQLEGAAKKESPKIEKFEYKKIFNSVDKTIINKLEKITEDFPEGTDKIGVLFYLHGKKKELYSAQLLKLEKGDNMYKVIYDEDSKKYFYLLKKESDGTFKIYFKRLNIEKLTREAEEGELITNEKLKSFFNEDDGKFFGKNNV